MRGGRESDPLRAEWLRFADSSSRLLQIMWPRWVSVRYNILHQPGSYGDRLHRWYFEEPNKWQRVTTGLDRLAAIGEERRICIEVLIHTKMVQFGFFHPFVPIYDPGSRRLPPRAVSSRPSRIPPFGGRVPRSSESAPSTTTRTKRGTVFSRKSSSKA